MVSRWDALRTLADLGLRVPVVDPEFLSEPEHELLSLWVKEQHRLDKEAHEKAAKK